MRRSRLGLLLLLLSLLSSSVFLSGLCASRNVVFSNMKTTPFSPKNLRYPPHPPPADHPSTSGRLLVCRFPDTPRAHAARAYIIRVHPGPALSSRSPSPRRTSTHCSVRHLLSLSLFPSPRTFYSVAPAQPVRPDSESLSLSYSLSLLPFALRTGPAVIADACSALLCSAVVRHFAIGSRLVRSSFAPSPPVRRVARLYARRGAGYVPSRISSFRWFDRYN